MRFWWFVGTRIIYWVARIFLGLRVYGRENVPLKGPVILAPNHLSNLDPPLVGSALGTREVYYLAKEGLFRERKFFAWLITVYNAIPLREGGVDRRALRRLIDLLGQGKVVVIFPEGTRSKTGRLLPAKEGIGLVALKAQVPIVPVRVVGSNARFAT